MEKIDFSSFDKQLVELYSKNRTEYEDESFSLGYINGARFVYCIYVN